MGTEYGMWQMFWWSQFLSQAVMTTSAGWLLALFSWLVLKAAWGLNADQKKGKSFPSELHFPLTYSSFLSLGTWISVKLLCTILQSHYLGQENTVQFLSRKSWNVRINILCLCICEEWKEHHLKRQPVGRFWGINSQVFLLKKVSEGFFVVMSCMK